MDYDTYFTDALAQLHNERRYRVFADLLSMIATPGRRTRRQTARLNELSRSI
jgi:hypothetical protein